MRLPPVWLGRALALAGALALAYAWWSARPGPFLALPAAWAAPLAGLAVLALVGRIALAWLPPGHIGGHGPSQLAATWAASHLLGTLGFTLLERVIPLRSGPFPGLALVFVAAIALAGALRLVTLPAAMVPRHASAHERPSSLALVLGRCAWVPVLAIALTSTAGARATGELSFMASLHYLPLIGALAGPSWPDWLAGAHYLALALLLRHALQSARLAPAGALCAWSLCVLVPAFARASTDELALALGLTSGAGFAVGWLRRAARRSLVLSLAGWTLALAAGGLVVALAGMTATLLAGARASRALYARGALACLAAGLFAASRPEGRPAARGSFGSLFDLESLGLAHAAALLALALAWLPALPRREPLVTRDGLSIDPPVEAARVSAAVVAATFLRLILAGDDRAPGALAALPCAALLAAAIFVRSAAPGGRVSE